jgi:HAD superfamily hydrolase (TIGR01549 family)
MNKNRFINKLAGCKYISFDIFDTLIERIVPSPRDVFNLIEIKYNKKHKNTQINNYKEQRIKAEELASLVANHKEIQYDDIYKNLDKVYGAKTACILKEMEIQVECQVLQKKDTGYQLYSYAQSEGFNIILTSDMYFSKEVITTFLDQCGINNYVRLFVSSESGNKKSNGTMYDFVCQEMGISNQELFHIGDNIRSDFYQAKKKDVRALWLSDQFIKRKLNRFKRSTFSDKTVLKSFIKKKQPKNKSLEEKIGYTALGPLLYGFSHWLDERVKSDNISKLLFLSREGLILQKAFHSIDHSGVKDEYFYLSRQAIILPSIWLDPSLEEIEKLTSLSRSVTTEVILKRLGIDQEIDEKYLNHYGLHLDTLIDGENLSSHKKFRKFYDSVIPLVTEKSKENYQNVKHYLAEHLIEGNVAIVDVGWNGSMQKALSKIVDKEFPEVTLYGYYVGTNPYSKYVFENKDKMKGYIFGYQHNPNKYIEEECMRSVFELQFLARHGSVNKIEKNSKVVLYGYENNEQVSISMGKIQEAALNFVKDYGRAFGDCINDVKNPCYYNRFFNHGIKPTPEIAKFFGDIVVIDHDKSHIAKVDKSNKLRGLATANWKVGYMTLLFGLRLPYYKLVFYKKKFDLKVSYKKAFK